VIRVQDDRLLADLRSLAAIGATTGGGVNRPAYGDGDLAARDLVRQWMRDAGLDVRMDAAGNTFGRLHGPRSDARPIVIGSHTDTVPDGGRFDGALGVLAALEVVRTIAGQSVALRHPLEVVNFQNEEGGLAGSRAVAGRLSASDLTMKAVSGYSLGDGIRRLGGDPDRLSAAVLAPGSIAAYVELHIEQGRFLERGGFDIGIVEGIVGIRYWEVTFDGVASHSGTTPMADRHDALLAAGRFIDAVHDAVTSSPGRHVGTVGRLTVSPGAPNVIAGRVTLTLELRDLDLARIDELFSAIASRAARIAADTGTRVALEPAHGVEPAPTDPTVREAIASAARDLGLSCLTMPSGAGHDTQNMAAIGPSGMLFVPSIEGISHSPREATHDHDVVNGANTLLGTVLCLDRALP
jgi:beta-ureidopropionase / N-carbamoyl-L-amino-acid hydrolase